MDFKDFFLNKVDVVGDCNFEVNFRILLLLFLESGRFVMGVFKLFRERIFEDFEIKIVVFLE